MGPTLALSVALALPGQESSATENRPRTPTEMAEVIDQALATHWQEQDIQPAGAADDATFLRRLSLDLRGTIPSRREAQEFLGDKDADRRSGRIQSFLNDPRTSTATAIQWSDLLLASAGNRRRAGGVRLWMEERLEQGQTFGQVVESLMAAEGRTDENGAVLLTVAYRDDAESLAAVVSRNLLGLQLQCAQCHDHPYDRWSQEDFQGFAAFFFNTRVRQVDGMEQNVFEVTDRTPEEANDNRVRRLMGLIRRANEEDDPATDASPSMTRRERARMARSLRDSLEGQEDPAAVEEILARLPEDKRERIEQDREKVEQLSHPRFLEDPWQPGVDTTPRQDLADWMRDRDNPWFARAVVNRTWAHLFGAGLVEPVDDLSAGEGVGLGDLLDELAAFFHDHDQDLRPLLEALTRSRAYALGTAPDTWSDSQRALAERHFAAHPVRPLSADQVLFALMDATASHKHLERMSQGTDEERLKQRMLGRFQYVFTDDESEQSDAFQAGIPQALFLMNSRLTNDAIRVRACDTLKEVLAEHRRTEPRLEQLYLATLGRPPTHTERSRLTGLLRDAPVRPPDAWEDVLWALLNSSEFLTNR